MTTFGETKIDPKIVEEIIKFSNNIQKAPKLVPAQDEIQLETTPYDVVYEEDKVRLLHYKPMTEKQIHTPYIIAYAVINRYHILDIHPKKSWVKNLLEQGIDVYMIDWGTPSNIDKYLDFDDYVNGYLDNCIEFVKDEKNVDQVSLQGYCTGGTLSAVYASFHPENIKNFVATAPVIDGWRDTTV
ncbi:MAG: alpha/beta fold hydrolase, partial [Thaumarchaeota archaeon]|nr:alpha/beta fold hydrolase [Nitrososphaerota archaeon]